MTSSASSSLLPPLPPLLLWCFFVNRQLDQFHFWWFHYNFFVWILFHFISHEIISDDVISPFHCFSFDAREMDRIVAMWRQIHFDFTILRFYSPFASTAHIFFNYAVGRYTKLRLHSFGIINGNERTHTHTPHTKVGNACRRLHSIVRLFGVYESINVRRQSEWVFRFPWIVARALAHAVICALIIPMCAAFYYAVQMRVCLSAGTDGRTDGMERARSYYARVR